MNSRAVQAAIAVVMLIAPRVATAQVQAQVTLNVPVNLTQLSPDISKIKLQCGIQSEAITTVSMHVQNQEVPTSGGQIVATVPVVFNLTNLDNPVGKTALAWCDIGVYSVRLGSWNHITRLGPDPELDIDLGQTGRPQITFTW